MEQREKVIREIVEAEDFGRMVEIAFEESDTVLTKDIIRGTQLETWLQMFWNVGISIGIKQCQEKFDNKGNKWNS